MGQNACFWSNRNERMRRFSVRCVRRADGAEGGRDAPPSAVAYGAVHTGYWECKARHQPPLVV